MHIANLSLALGFLFFGLLVTRCGTHQNPAPSPQTAPTPVAISTFTPFPTPTPTIHEDGDEDEEGDGDGNDDGDQGECRPASPPEIVSAWLQSNGTFFVYWTRATGSPLPGTPPYYQVLLDGVPVIATVNVYAAIGGLTPSKRHEIRVQAFDRGCPSTPSAAVLLDADALVSPLVRAQLYSSGSTRRMRITLTAPKGTWTEYRLTVSRTHETKTYILSYREELAITLPILFAADEQVEISAIACRGRLCSRALSTSPILHDSSSQTLRYDAASRRLSWVSSGFEIARSIELQCGADRKTIAAAPAKANMVYLPPGLEKGCLVRVIPQLSSFVEGISSGALRL